MRTIQITVSPTGETTVATLGYQGSECQAASRFIEDALGQRVSEQLTSEFHAAAVETSLSTTAADPGS